MIRGRPSFFIVSTAKRERERDSLHRESIGTEISRVINKTGKQAYRRILTLEDSLDDESLETAVLGVEVLALLGGHVDGGVRHVVAHWRVVCVLVLIIARSFGLSGVDESVGLV